MLVSKNKIIFLVFMAFLLGLPFFTLASTTNGTIDSTYKYAWSDNIGWINFAPTGSGGTYEGLVIADSSVTGYAWSNNLGWINFGPFLNNSGGGVKNTSAGVLSGYAWSNNLGWINFSGVIINSSGQFTGTASGDLVGTINFNLTHCTNCGVKTDWRPASQRGGGGGLPSVAYNPPSAPSGGFSVLINNAQVATNNPIVILKFQAGSDTKKMAISESPNFKNAVQEDYQATRAWVLSQGDGPKTIYVKFYTWYGQPSQTVSSSIVLNAQPTETKINSGTGAVVQPFNPPVSPPISGLKKTEESKPTTTISSKNPVPSKSLVQKIYYLFTEGTKALWWFITNFITNIKIRY